MLTKTVVLANPIFVRFRTKINRISHKLKNKYNTHKIEKYIYFITKKILKKFIF